ncbi:hypothetical protein PAE9249_00401 [Paenibacillus sp. CECT 9249]|uniref:DUF4912 domain-containing protein n=1 Tax=Paenibacillus sp. CECT 9249 TaxID=2845385 RepID=UPI001E28CE8B|nr:DUF4912 domain-containing protein [Paenibacillus sp. CECT 9249]CAH0117936.1 hypothetical protein PAE9249_00401 [Paenibacillus sp. CECT 9249]
MFFNQAADLPYSYNCDTFHLMARDPATLFAYWEVSTRKQAMTARHYRIDWDAMPKAVRLYRISGGRGADANDRLRLTEYTDVRVEHASSWYFRDLKPGSVYVADFGMFNPFGQFIPLLRSNPASTPAMALQEAGADETDNGGASLQIVFDKAAGAKTPESTSPYETFSTYTLYSASRTKAKDQTDTYFSKEGAST